jgi:hypothetical protein
MIAPELDLSSQAATKLPSLRPAGPNARPRRKLFGRYPTPCGTGNAISWTEPLLTPEERRRRVVRLCCSFLRNLAFYRAGMQREVQVYLFAPRNTEGAFWREAHVNFFDICVLEWCKLFADRRGEHQWSRVVDERDRFEAELYTALGVTPAEFTKLIAKVKHYRDKFVAHLDQERKMHPPMLEVPKTSIAVLYQRLVRHIDDPEDWLGLPTTAEQLEQGYAQASREAISVYDEALARIRPAI